MGRATQRWKGVLLKQDSARCRPRGKFQEINLLNVLKVREFGFEGLLPNVNVRECVTWILIFERCFSAARLRAPRRRSQMHLQIFGRSITF